MKVYLGRGESQDYVLEHNGTGIEMDVPEALFRRYQSAAREWDAVQEALAMLVNSAS